MTNHAKGAAAEREACKALNALLGTSARRMLRAGRSDDVGDIDGIPGCTIQVRALKDLGTAIRSSVRDAEKQRITAGNRWALGLVPTTYKGRRLWLACTATYVHPDDYRLTLWPRDVPKVVGVGGSIVLARKGCEDVYITPLDVWADAYREAALSAGLLRGEQ